MKTNDGNLPDLCAVHPAPPLPPRFSPVCSYRRICRVAPSVPLEASCCLRGLASEFDIMRSFDGVDWQPAGVGALRGRVCKRRRWRKSSPRLYPFSEGQHPGLPPQHVGLRIALLASAATLT